MVCCLITLGINLVRSQKVGRSERKLVSGMEQRVAAMPNSVSEQLILMPLHTNEKTKKDD